MFKKVKISDLRYNELPDKTNLYEAIKTEWGEDVNPEDFEVIIVEYGDYSDIYYEAVFKYLKENYPNNTIICFGTLFFFNSKEYPEILDEFLQETEDYPLGFGMDDFYSNLEFERVWESLEDFYKTLKEYKHTTFRVGKEEFMRKVYDLAGGYYAVYVFGMDYSEDELIERCRKEGLIR